MASWERCPHVDASLRTPDDLKCRKVFFSYRAPSPTPQDDPTPLEKAQPWIDMMRDLLLESQLAQDVINRILRICVPLKHRHAINPIVEDATPTAAEKPPIFHRFYDLPAELRMAIWELAAAEPRRILPWGEYWSGGQLPLNVPKHMPRVAQTCKEAWDVINAKGGYCEPHHEPYDMLRAKPGSLKGVWASVEDLVYLPAGLKYEPWLTHVNRAWGLDFLCARKELAVEFNDFVLLGPSRRAYRFLRHAQRLKTLICILNVQD